MGVAYGPPGERFRLAGAPSGRASWASWPGWAILTAHNPGGQRVETVRNASADEALRRVLSALNIPASLVVNGEGEWAEPAWLLRGVSLHDAARLGRQFGQAAVLWGVGRRVALVALAPWRVRRFWVALQSASGDL